VRTSGPSTSNLGLSRRRRSPTEKLLGASAWEAELYEHLTSHEAIEGEMLVEYRDVAAASPSKAFRYLSDLIIEDEIRHHRIFRDLAAALKSDVELDPAEPVIPKMGDWGQDAATVLSLTENLLERERADATELRGLSSELKSLKPESLWHLLVHLMEMDTAKHIEILEFVQRNVKKSLR
jgi:rubrerythrin